MGEARAVARLVPAAIATMGALLVGACAGAPPGSAIAPAAVDTTWYISARAREDGRDTPRLADSLEYGAVITERRWDDPLAGRLPFRDVDSLQFTREEFVSRLRARVASGPALPEGAPDRTGFAVFYTHGFGTSLREAWQHTSTARARARSTAPWVVFAWPSIGAGLSWPLGGDLVRGAYVRDSLSVIASRGAYTRALGAVREAVGNGGTLVVAHSMGGQLVGETLAADSALRAALAADPLRAVAFMAPDIEAMRFGDSLVPALRPLTRRLLLYAAADDRVLAIAGMLSETQRAGKIGGRARTPVVRDGLESVDMTDGANAEGLLRRTFGARHALRQQLAALFDLVHLVGPGFAPACRESIGTALVTPSGAWQLTPDALPPTTTLTSCAAPADGTLDQRAPAEGSTIASTLFATRAFDSSPERVTLRR